MNCKEQQLTLAKKSINLENDFNKNTVFLKNIKNTHILDLYRIVKTTL